MKRFIVLVGIFWVASMASAAMAQDIKGAANGALMSARGGSSAGGEEVDDFILSMNQVGVTHSYKALTDRYTSMVPFGKMDSFDLESAFEIFHLS